MADVLMFHELDAIIRDVIGVTKATTRRSMARRIAGDIRRNQQKRIGRQKNPDGTAYKARRKKKIGTQGGIRFLWNGQTRSLRNWRHSKGRYGDRMITGFDEERGSIRSFLRDDIERYLSVDLRRSEKTKTKPDPMFRRLRQERFLKASAYPDAAVVGFSGRAAAIARIHQDGLSDKVSHNATARYPQRQLLGLTEADLDAVTEAITDALKGAR